MTAADLPWTPAQRFAYALVAHYNESQKLPEDHLPADAPEARETILAMLARDWSATGAADIRSLLSRLGEGGHRHGHRLMVRRYSLFCRPEIAARREELRDHARTDPEALGEIWRMQAVQEDRHGVRAAPLLAFDAGRAMMLARAAMFLGWMPPQVVWPYLLAVAADVQRSFPGWAAYAQDYRCGFALWRGGDRPGVHHPIIERLLAPDGLWQRLPWGAPGLELPLPETSADEDEPAWTLERWTP